MSRDYSLIVSNYHANMLKDADEAITACNLWGWLKTAKVGSNHPNWERIRKAMKYHDHTGSSYSWTMEIMKDIATRGWDVCYREQLQMNEEEDRKYQEYQKIYLALKAEYGF